MIRNIQITFVVFAILLFTTLLTVATGEDAATEPINYHISAVVGSFGSSGISLAQMMTFDATEKFVPPAQNPIWNFEVQFSSVSTGAILDLSKYIDFSQDVQYTIETVFSDDDNSQFIPGPATLLQAFGNIKLTIDSQGTVSGRVSPTLTQLSEVIPKTGDSNFGSFAFILLTYIPLIQQIPHEYTRFDSDMANSWATTKQQYRVSSVQILEENLLSKGVFGHLDEATTIAGHDTWPVELKLTLAKDAVPYNGKDDRIIYIIFQSPSHGTNFMVTVRDDADPKCYINGKAFKTTVRDNSLFLIADITKFDGNLDITCDGVIFLVKKRYDTVGRNALIAAVIQTDPFTDYPAPMSQIAGVFKA